MAKILKDIQYVMNGHERQRLDLYLPNDGSKTPLIIYIHGGAFMFGDKDSRFLPRRMLDQSYAIASLNYRLSGDAIFPATIEDCKAAVRWLRAHASEYNLNDKKFFAWGESAGGHQAAMLGTTKIFDVGENLEFSSAVQGVVDYYGPTDFLQMDANALPNSHKHDPADSPESKYVGGKITDHPDLVQAANPIYYISNSTCPFFIAHGTEDHVVPFHQSQILITALEKANIPVTFHPVNDTDHCFDGMTQAQSAALDKATDDFLNNLI